MMDSQAWPHDSVTGAQNSSPQTAQRREASSALAGDRGPQSSGWVMPPTSASMLVFSSRHTRVVCGVGLAPPAGRRAAPIQRVDDWTIREKKGVDGIVCVCGALFQIWGLYVLEAS